MSFSLFDCIEIEVVFEAGTEIRVVLIFVGLTGV